MNSAKIYYELYKLSVSEQEEFVGETIMCENTPLLVVKLDEFTSRMYYGCPVAVLGVYKLQGHSEAIPQLLVMMPSLDDTCFRAFFNPSIDIHLSSLTELIRGWARRQNCRHINVHALEDYCRYLGAESVDWS